QEAFAWAGFLLTPAMLVQLLRTAIYGLLLGPFMPQTRPDLTCGIAVAAFAAGLVLLLWRGERRVRRITGAMAALAASMYGLIALGRAFLYQAYNVPLDEASLTLRYHYVGSIPVV